MLARLKNIPAFFFWLLNLSLATTVLGWLGTFVWQILSQASYNDIKSFFSSIPLDIAITIVVVLAMPFLLIALVFITKNQHNSTKLSQLLLGVELPTIAFTIARLIFLKTLIPTNILFLSTAVISIFAYIIYIFKKSYNNRLLKILHTLALQSAVVVGVYASLLMFFFLPIFIAFIFQIINSLFHLGFSFGNEPNLWILATGLISFFAFSLLALSLICSPFIGLVAYFKASARLDQHFKSARLGFSSAYVFLTLILAYQSSLIFFNSQIDVYKNTTEFKQRSKIASQILKNQNFIKNRLVDTYLAHYQYLTDSQMSVLKQAYLDQTNIKEPLANNLQNWFLALAYPFVYQGHFEEDVKNADQNYQLIFDEPIQLAQSQKVKSILSTSFNISSDQLKSSILDREDQDVLLVNRQISVTPDSRHQFATVTIEEEYENLTPADQEVFYLFSLPQDSVITDLKLGPDLNLTSDHLETISPIIPTPAPQVSLKPTLAIPKPIEQKDSGQVAPKGAADSTFENQYRFRIDPAILEQVSPVSYQLRVYPIPVTEKNLSSWQRDNLTAPVRNQKVRYSYVTVIDQNGQVALPKIQEQRNLVKSDKTIFAASQPIPNFSPNSPNLRFVNGLTQTLYLHQPNTSLVSIDNKKIAILADSSYTMGVKDWQSFLSQQLPLSTLVQTNIVDLYYFNDLVSPAVNLNQQINNPKAFTQVAFGQTNRLQALKYVQGKYDLVLMFTDPSPADSSSQTSPSLQNNQAIYLIFKDNQFPKFPDPLTFYLQANRAIITSSGQLALENYAHLLTLKNQFANSSVLVTDSGSWVTMPTSISSPINFQTLSPSDPAAKLALHRQIETQMGDSSRFDSLNSLAASAGIVTPLSSLIVLTTPEQKEQLRLASLGQNRFTSNFNLGEEQLIEPQSGGFLSGSAVPEPHEWLLIITSLLLFGFLGRHQIKALVSSHA
ncbi:MAG: hypothetical protein WCV93_03005 [Candidatus Shapirobacteria bacterium]